MAIFNFGNGNDTKSGTQNPDVMPGNGGNDALSRLRGDNRPGNPEGKRPSPS